MGVRRRLQVSGATVFLTGAGSGIGAATARALVAHGAKVALADLHLEPLERLAADLGPDTEPVVVDVTDLDALTDAVARTVTRFGGLDVCVANAGIAAAEPTTIERSPVAEFEKIVEVDLLGVWRTVRACLPEIRKTGGHFLLTASTYAFLNGIANAPYALSKAGVESFGRSLRCEIAGAGMTAGVLYPGWVSTPIIEASHRADSVSQQMLERAFPKALLTAVTPEEVAAAAVRGIGRRSPRIVVPRRYLPVSLARGVVNVVTDALISRDRTMQSLVAKLGG